MSFHEQSACDEHPHADAHRPHTRFLSVLVVFVTTLQFLTPVPAVHANKAHHRSEKELASMLKSSFTSLNSSSPSSSQFSEEIFWSPSVSCPLNSSVNIVYYADLNGGVDEGSNLWVSHFFTWWAKYDPNIVFLGLTAAQVQACNFSAYSDTLRLYLNPGGSAVPQLIAYGVAGSFHIQAWMEQQPGTEFASDNQPPHVYVGICAGGYVASSDYIWETQYFGNAYFVAVGSPLPLSVFPYRLEGSIVDVGDDEYGNYDSTMPARGIGYRMINVTTVFGDEQEELEMLYYGGSTFGWNAVENYLMTSSSSGITPLMYFSDVYGYMSPNVPAMYQYGDYVLISTVHPEADQSTCSSDCPSAGTLTLQQIETNYRLFANQINRLMGYPFKVPDSSSSSFTTSSTRHSRKKKNKSSSSLPSSSSLVSTSIVKGTSSGKPLFPRSSYPQLNCYSARSSYTVIFCDDFQTPKSIDMYPGLFQWQRNQTYYYESRPWNVTFSGTMLASTTNYYGLGAAGAGDGWAVSVPTAPTTTYPYASMITSKPLVFVPSSSDSSSSSSFYQWSPYQSQLTNFTYVAFSYTVKGLTMADGYFVLQYTCNDAAQTWSTLRTGALNTLSSGVFVWKWEEYSLSISSSSTTCGTKANPLQFKFWCYTGSYATYTYFCGVDDVYLVAY